MAARRAQAQYLIVHDLAPPPGQVWDTIDRYQYFSVFSPGTETFYAQVAGFTSLPRKCWA
jgi:hypothetical protein